MVFYSNWSLYYSILLFGPGYSLAQMVKASHARHNSEHVVVGGIDTDLGSLGSLNSGVGEDKLEGSVIYSGEVACAAGLVLLRSQSK
jgi:hypothetical protein